MLNATAGSRSLRLRLFFRIVVPLVIVASAVGVWRTWNAFETAKAIFDRNLTAISIAVARDVASSGGELLSPETHALLAEASGGKVFYHVYGPDGAYVTGFGYPPATPSFDLRSDPLPMLFDSRHAGEPVRVSGLVQFVNASGIDGLARITVWQQQSLRRQFALNQALLSLGVITLLVAAVMVTVWLSVSSGLAPLIQLRNAIARRNPQDLRPINYPAPEEVRPLVETVNALLGEVQGSIDARDRFIGNAAHQLRNPISAVQALAESAGNAKTPEETHRRIAKTIAEAKHTSHLAEQLLMLEQLSQPNNRLKSDLFDLGQIAAHVSSRIADRALDQGIEFSFDEEGGKALVKGDGTMLAEALENLVDNALSHGGDKLSKLRISRDLSATMARVTVEDDGQGIGAEDRELVFERFTQLDFGHGSGLGLSIVREIVEAHGGTIAVSTGIGGKGARFDIALPLIESDAANP